MTGFGNDPIPGVTEDDTAPSAASSNQAIVLRVLNGPCKGREIPVDRPTLVLGRDDPPHLHVDVDLTDCELASTPVISRRHAEIRLVAGQLQIVALQDRNGTFVNGTRITHDPQDNPSSPVALKHGDTIRLANLELEVSYGGS